jgi:hypothetical protein
VEPQEEEEEEEEKEEGEKKEEEEEDRFGLLRRWEYDICIDRRF